MPNTMELRPAKVYKNRALDESGYRASVTSDSDSDRRILSAVISHRIYPS
jgi:hypothetical protein